jgi:hypothetical protein
VHAESDDDDRDSNVYRYGELEFVSTDRFEYRRGHHIFILLQLYEEGMSQRNMRFIGFKRRVPGLGRFHIWQRADPFIDAVKRLSYQQFAGRFGYV